MHVLRRRVKLFRYRLTALQLRDVGMELLQHVDQEGRCAGAKPVVVDFVHRDGVQQTEWIIDTFAAFREVVTVVPPFHLGKYLFVSRLVGKTQLMDAIGEIVPELLFGDAAYGGKVGSHGDVH